ncbi:MAG: efflux transporter outer membrane subunit [Rhodoferax sp.]|uniref:efflux transporter outer membrane subunit n=1 Tax=Rhodoferax sp. TaxID=50421 RepID=UPI002ACDFC7A|nr:efflux transporter outer membrane subunit [Rhodoferax sp.]MDZ7891516.1 efflux transporter outer membrane subunit [Rhodoferax sp.]
MALPHSFLHRLRLQNCAAACLMTVAALSSQAATMDLPHAAPVALPSQWSQAGSTTPDSLASWWELFNDPQLSALVTQALQANPSLRKATAALQQARALRDAKQGALLPGLNASSSGQRSQTNEQAATNVFKAGLDASWEPDLFGAQRATLNASEGDAQAQEATLADAQVSLAAEVALAYLQLRGQQSQLTIAQTNLTSQQETLQLTDWRAQAGVTTSLEVAQARTAVEQTRAEIPTLQASIAASQHSLAVLTGQAPTALVSALGTAAPIPRAPEQLAMAFPADTLRQRPDVRAEEARIAAALARVQVAEAARYPTFSIGGSLGLSAVTLAGLTNGASVLSSLLASVSLPVFDGGANAATLRAQKAALVQAQASYQSTVLTALQEVEDALAALRGHRARLQHLQSAATAAELAALLAQQRYASGLIDFQTVLTTQRTLLSAQNSVANTTTDLGTGYVRLYKALGGGWQPDAAAAEAATPAPLSARQP